MIKKTMYILLFCVFALINVYAQDDLTYDELIQKGIALIDVARNGNESDAISAIEVFEKVLELKETPENYAWLGCAWAVRADKNGNVINKVDFINKGCSYIDKAVSMDENNLITRRIRIETYSYLPEDIFEKGKVVEDDLKFLMKLYSTNPTLFNETTYDGAWSFYTYALLLYKKGNIRSAKNYLNTAKKIVKDESLKNQIVALIGGKK